MMAAYWRSPYKESSHFGKHGPTTSTGRFEQSLSLSRAKSSILTSSQDVFGWNLPTPRRPGSSQQPQNSFTGNLKGILKAPRGRLSPRLRVRTDEAKKDESNSDEKSNTLRSSKRVSFGPCEDTFDDESEGSASNSRGLRAHFVTLQRLNHSRKVEESAMQKLNKLISGFPSKMSKQAISDLKTSTTHTSPLPVVNGKGLLTPRQEMPVCTCKHRPDLKCADCANKDVETGEIEVKDDTTVSQELESCDNSKPDFGIDADPDSTTEQSKNDLVDSVSETVKLPLSLTLFEELEPHISREKSNARRRTPSYKPKPVSFQNKKFQSKLLPGRYPFNTSVIYLRNSGQTKKTNSDKTRSEAIDKPDASVQSHDKTDADVQKDVQKDDSKPDSKSGHKQVSPDSTQTQSTEYSDGNRSHVPIIKSRSDSRERRYMDKTTQILTWLKDVRQKQNFKPRNSRFLVVESQP